MDANTRLRREDHLDSLTPKEREVLDLIVRGQTNAEIAESLHITFPTAKSHVSAVLSKLGVESRQDAARVANSRRGSAVRAKLRMFGLGVFALKAAGVVAVIAVVGVAGATSVMMYGGASGDPMTFRIPLAELRMGEPRAYRPPGLGSDPYGRPYELYAVRQEDGSVLAFLGRDLHSGCIVPFDPGYLWPPVALTNVTPLPEQQHVFRAWCSGSVYTLAGEAVFGPTPRGLDHFVTSVDDNAVVVNLEELVVGACRGEMHGTCSEPGAPVVVRTPLPASAAASYR